MRHGHAHGHSDDGLGTGRVTVTVTKRYGWWRAGRQREGHCCADVGGRLRVTEALTGLAMRVSVRAVEVRVRYRAGWVSVSVRARVRVE